MRVIVIGGTGTIGSAVVKLLSTRHDVVTVGHKRGTYQVDLASTDSIASLFKTIGTCDAVVSTAGIAKFASLDDLTYDDYFIGLKNKLMGQANLVRIGRPFVTNHGSRRGGGGWRARGAAWPWRQLATRGSRAAPPPVWRAVAQIVAGVAIHQRRRRGAARL